MVSYDDENGGGPLLLRRSALTIAEMFGDGFVVHMLDSLFGTRYSGKRACFNKLGIYFGELAVRSFFELLSELPADKGTERM